jgi:hypothetical protein
MILASHGLIGSQIQSFVGLLDLYPSAAAAYSLRLLRALYTGNAIRVRRSSDNAEQDIGFNGANLDTATLTSFCGSGNGFVTTWYDQSGNGNNATQTTAGNQPQIVSSGSIINVNSKPSLSFDAVNDNLNIINSASNLKFLHSNLSTIITVNKTNSTSGNGIVGSNRGTGSNVGFYLYGTTQLQHVISNGGLNIVINTSTTTISTNTQYLNFITGDPSNATLNQRSLININNSSVNQNNTNTGTPSTANSVGDVQIAALGGNAETLNGNYQELIIYSSIQSANRTGIQNNINTYYAIY